MGCDKASLPFEGQPLALYQAGKLSGFCSQVYLCGERGRDSLFGGIPWIPDKRPGRAAILGIEAALDATREEWNVILAVDLPLVPPEFLRGLLQVAGEKGIAALCPSADGGPHPLASIWNRAAMRPLKAQLDRGEFSIQAAIRSLGGCLLSEPETVAVPGFVAGCLRNVNSPADWEAVLGGERKREKEKGPGIFDPGPSA